MWLPWKLCLIVMLLLHRLLLVYEVTPPPDSTPRQSSPVISDDYPCPPPLRYFVSLNCTQRLCLEFCVAFRSHSSSESLDVDGEDAQAGDKQKRMRSHHRHISSGIRQFFFHWARGLVRKRGSCGKRARTVDGWDFRHAKDMFTNIDVCPMDHLRHNDLTTNGNPYIGLPPVSKPKFDEHMDFNWEETLQEEEFQASIQELLQVILDRDGVIIAVKARPIKGVCWEFMVESVEEQLALLNTCFTHYATEVRREHSVRTEPKDCNEWHQPIREFIDHPDVHIFANHMSGGFASDQPL
ncbi:hypothetical protein EXIGLDRAFT_705020 [Exidia glandulosa HHB12029]|uniref:Uncharacterized protein n=1 Tax=Exidia glandulosa HHB12029 TaxID=1314781 RepID=A0A165Z9E4_EXIGL|nr:hypothetical protein EXIGLDRAFT_705020 [Exidia glandulosa HHB12029]